jgi:hypothetical protein
MRKKWQLMSYNMMIGYDIYDCFTMEHLRLRQCHFKIWLDCHKLKISKNEKKMAINVIQHDDRL